MTGQNHQYTKYTKVPVIITWRLSDWLILWSFFNTLALTSIAGANLHQSSSASIVIASEFCTRLTPDRLIVRQLEIDLCYPSMP